MTDRLDLLKIAQEEANGDLFKYLDGVFKRSKIQPRGISDAIIWEGGHFAAGVNPVAPCSRPASNAVKYTNGLKSEPADRGACTARLNWLVR